MTIIGIIVLIAALIVVFLKRDNLFNKSGGSNSNDDVDDYPSDDE